jgi:uncharacterized membrane protein YoaK (UPF0700 family)
MTGNTVLLGLALAQGELLAALRSILALLGFVAGAAVGALIVERHPRDGVWPPVVTGALALEAVVLGVFGWIWHLSGAARGGDIVYALIVLSALAMGIQAAAVRYLGVPGIATTYITGTLTSLAVELVAPLVSAAVPSSPAGSGAPVQSSPGWERRVGLLAAVFFVYGLGALAGGILQARASPWLTLLPLVAVACVVANASILHRHPPRDAADREDRGFTG